ncbi:hypothetical protein NMY22_g8866 [Coprinellus aureogranulatus]|nr:hypothetical protein NMY22_g8866 [Coprinellus aureogranulatus]
MGLRQIFITTARGSGISYTLPLLLDVIRQSSIGGSSEVRRVLFVWVVRGDGHLPWIAEALSKALPRVRHPLEIEVRIHVTGANIAETAPSGSMNSISDSEKNMAYTEPISTTNALRIHHGRPNVKGLLHDEITSSTGPVSVNVAGPGALTASVRSSLTAGVAAPGWAYKRGHTVTLHVETFGMVQT